MGLLEPDTEAGRKILHLVIDLLARLSSLQNQLPLLGLMLY